VLRKIDVKGKVIGERIDVMRFTLKPEPERIVGQQRIITKFIICRIIGLELRTFEVCKIKQIFVKGGFDYDSGDYYYGWEDIAWVD
jgi:hypothetical protein